MILLCLKQGLGFFPDVGTTWYLARLPHCLGVYLALTGARINLSDCVMFGLIDYPVKHDIFPEIIYALADTSLMGDEPRNMLTEVLQPFMQPVGSSELWSHRMEIEACFKQKTIEDILHALKNSSSFWIKNAEKIIRTKSPTSLKVTLHALQEAENLDFDECIEMEFRLCNHFLEGHDFFEGVRALLIDKDQKPHWKPDSLDGVTQRELKKYFQPIEDELPLT